MSQSTRQSNLFAGEDWKKIYQSFLQVNFVSYDFDTIHESLIQYIRINYPEDFNDFIASSEFITIIDLLSWLGESLAFRVDLNVRENFIDTAERRESILKLASLLSYKAKRNKAAQGFLKIVGVRTNADIIDSNGNNLNGVKLEWNDPHNPDWYEQFILALNTAFTNSNQFGQPVQSGIDAAGSRVQTYQFNTRSVSNPGVYSFTANADGQSLIFENVNVSWSEDRGYTERSPNPFNNFHILYKNDSLGNQSKDTGFFTYFKQGSLKYVNHNFTVPVENRIVDIDVFNINNDDVWVQNIDSTGSVLVDWIKVPSTVNTNIVYNDLSRSNRNIFSVETRENDQVSIRFSDGKFGSIPFGVMRFYHRVSYGDRTTIRPSDIQNQTITIPFLTDNNLQKEITLYISLQETITNGAPAETNDEVKRNAGQVYYTQNRMVTGEDYNVFPLSDPAIVKLKAINRTYAGHNRYIDINDPTAMYQNTNVLGDDGILYSESDNNIQQLTNRDNATPDQIITDIIQPFMIESEFKNFMYDVLKNYAISCSAYNHLYTMPPIGAPSGLMWDRITGNNYSSTGRFVFQQALPVPTSAQAIAVGVAIPAINSISMMKEGSLIKFENAGWVTIDTLIDNGRGTTEGFADTGNGKIRLNQSVKEGDIVTAVIPATRFSLNSLEINAIRLKLQTNSTFGLFYDISVDSWIVIDPPVNYPYNGFDKSDSYSYCDPSKKWFILIENNSSSDNIWTITARGLRYVFESSQDARFFFVNKYKIINNSNGLAANDTINILGTNQLTDLAKLDSIPKYISGFSYPAGYILNLNDTIYKALVDTDYTFIPTQWVAINPSIGRDIKVNLVDNFTYEDGYIEPRRVLVSFTDNDSDGVIDDPEVFDRVIYGNQDPLHPTTENLVFWQKYTSYDGYTYFKPIDHVKTFAAPTITSAIRMMNLNYINEATRSQWNDGDIAYVLGSNSQTSNYYIFDIDNTYANSGNLPTGFIPGDTKIPGDQPTASPDMFKSAIGRKGLSFIWKHYAPTNQRIDPAISNIIDVYVLSSEYDFLVRQYLQSTDSKAIEPTPPSTTQLSIAFKELESFKMISDQLIWKPVKYNLLFGAKAKEELRGRIKIVKIPNATMSDGEIKTEVINLINDYFSIDNWDFGDTFYFSELATYIHQGLATQIASVVLVPVNEESAFGDLYEVKSNPDEIFISAATVNDIDIITVNTQTALRIKR